MRFGNSSDNLNSGVNALTGISSFSETVLNARQKYRLAFPDGLRSIMNDLPNSIRDKVYQIEFEYHMEKVDPTYDVLELLRESGVIESSLKEDIISSIMRKNDYEIEEKMTRKFEKFSENSSIVQSSQLKGPMRPVTKQNIIIDFDKQIEELIGLLSKVKSCYNKLSEALALDETNQVKVKLKEYKEGLPEIRNSIIKLKKSIEKEGLIKQEEMRLLGSIQEVEFMYEEIINRHKRLEETVKPSLFKKKVKLIPMLEIIEEKDSSLDKVSIAG